MTLASDPALQRIEAAIEAEAENLCPGAMVMTGYAILTEWAGANGEVYLIESFPDEQAWWRDLGMIDAASARIKMSALRTLLDGDD